ncbi:MAG: porin [Caulobacteraceae bacterium]|nr:porin [Caulobacteraceae bacterium]
MSHSILGLRGRLFLSAAGAVWLAMGPGQALAASPDSSDAEALRAQVAALTQLVKSVSERDQQQIEALSAQVQALQTRLNQEEIATTDQTARPRAAQNATGHFTLEGSQRAPEAQTAVPRVVQNATHRFAMQSADGQYSIGLTGDIQFDTGGDIGFHPASKVVGPQALSTGVNARRARIGIAGTAAGDWGYAFVYDAGNSSDQTAKGIETAQIIYGGLKGAAFEIGYSNTYFTLDQATGSNDTLFVERASPSNIATNLNAGDARSNAGVRFFGDRYWVGAYVTGPASGDSHTLTGERFGAFQRVAVQALKGPDYTLHLGVGVDELLRAPNSGNGTAYAISLSDQPELRIDPTTLLNTGTLGSLANPVTGAYVFDAETAATWRNLFWQGEYYHYEIERRGLSTAAFDGAYGQVSWTLTGETHRYNPQAASYFRISPTHAFSLAHGGWGAWELAARVSYVDLDSNFRSGHALSAQPGAVDGGIQRGYSFGVNWYPNDLIRFLLDYEHVDYEKANGTAVAGAPLGAPVGAKLDSIALRAQVAY